MVPFGQWFSHLEINFALCENFAPCFARCENGLEVCENGTRVPGGDFARCENFRTLNSGVRKWHLGNSHLEQGISHLVLRCAKLPPFRLRNSHLEMHRAKFSHLEMQCSVPLVLLPCLAFEEFSTFFLIFF